MQTNSRRVYFEGSLGRLAATLHLPSEPRGRGVLLTHCFTCNKDYKILVRVARALCARGWAALRFDFSAAGSSQGRFEEVTLADYLRDLQKAAAWLASQGYEALAVVGHSLGGTAALLASPEIPSLRFLAVLGTPSCSDDLLRVLDPARRQALERGETVQLLIQGRPYPITPGFVRELGRHSLAEVVSRPGPARLVIHGTRDKVVPIEEGERLFALCAQPKSFLAVPGADHLFSRPAHAERVARWLACWLED